MNARRRLQREIIRHRRRHRLPWAAPVRTRITTPNGIRVRVYLYGPRRVNPCPLHRMHADYWGHQGGPVYASWPPTPDTLRELGRWA